ncbi:MAG: hypothetical protein LBE03_01545 [Candidatus Nomurabacteria bacterium]|jgi:hypothetical protein|nr:hypothetical protein [Candidatus Nomurabacteria bacterium]
MEIIKALYSSFDGVTWTWPTLVPEWIIPDVIVLLLGVLTIGFIIKKEKRPLPLLLEIFCFIFLYAAIYENLATIVGWYGYGQGLTMIFNVPLSVPLIEALFVYAGIRFALAMKIPKWTIPLLVGSFGVLADLTLDPLSLAQVHGGIGRWSWFIGAGDVNIFGAPVYNYVGWFLLCGYATAFILLGRLWHEKSGYKKSIGVLYPPLTMLAALLVMVSPLSSFLLWLAPVFNKGGPSEYLMFGLVFVILAIILLVWRGRMRHKLSWQNDYIIPVVFGIFYLTNIMFDLVAWRLDILLFSLPFIAVHMLIIFGAFSANKSS